ncbi:MAG: hypothetical protein KGI00_04910 [Candidatus Micrarchaeota archaeon]|nr:hypothetical protein [Candidatus Micrarchaeota archaeon]
MYKLGVIGLGHWFERLYEGIKKTDMIAIDKAASVSGIEKKGAQLTRLGIMHDRYYKLVPGAPIPDEFFKGLDIVHISNPNQFHAEQTLQSLSSNKITITEKTFGVNKKEFSRVLNYITRNELQGKAYLHLHYVHKQLVLRLPGLLQEFTETEGKVVSTAATFFEMANEEGIRRSSWLFKPESGGLFMDWIHPFEIYLKGALASSMTLHGFKKYAVNTSYDSDNPTGIEAEVLLQGRFFSKDAKAVMRVSEGVDQAHKTKVARFFFESGNHLDLNFIDSGLEFTSSNRGSWELRKGKDNSVIRSGRPGGPTSSDILVSDMVGLCEGSNPGLTIDEMKALFEPQWDYQRTAKDAGLITDLDEVAEFMRNGSRVCTAAN